MSGNVQLTPILATARDILKEHNNSPMHVNEIAAAAVKSARNQSMSVEDFSSKLSSALAAHLKITRQKPIFTKPLNKQGRPQKGIYRLKQVRVSTIASKIIPPEVSTNFMGKAGEHAVMSELLFWGYNASLMSVDEGIDIVASKDNKYFHVQVKASTERSSGVFGFQVKRKAFDLNNLAQTYYIFVMRRNLTCYFAVLPSSHLENLRMTNIITGQNDLSITITADEKSKRFSLNGSDITGWVNNFGVIR
jgi:hypothetical protein